MDFTAELPHPGKNWLRQVRRGNRQGAGSPSVTVQRCGGRVSIRVAIALWMASVLPSLSLANEPPPSVEEARLQATATQGLRWAFYAPNGYRWEYSGILVTHEGELRYSPSPRTLQKVDAVEMDAEKLLSPGDVLVGLYHTHPCKPEQYFSQYYSPQDLVSAFFYHVPSFILDECTGKVHEFDPVHDIAADTGTVVPVMRKDGTRKWLRLPAGRVVGDIGDQGPDLSQIERLMSRAMY